jgi:nucleotide-binding universal stress UspA family protein
MRAIGTILHPTDLSDGSLYIFQVAGALARAQGARLIIFHVETPLGPALACGRALAMLRPEKDRQMLAKALQLMHSADPNVAVERWIAIGDPAAEILRHAKGTACDLIVMGTRRGRGERSLGSVASQVVAQAPCPIVTVDQPQRLSVNQPQRRKEQKENTEMKHGKEEWDGRRVPCRSGSCS